MRTATACSFIGITFALFSIHDGRKLTRDLGAIFNHLTTREAGTYPSYMRDVEKLIREKRIAFTKPLPQKVAFHDACHMARVAKVYEAPRQALKFIRDLKVLEIQPHHEDALCSGAGGGFPAVFPEQAARVS